MTNANEQDDVKDNEILLNIMYTGTYLEDDNIGHEAVNLFKDDNGRNYIYVLPDGRMNKEHNKKIKNILLIRRCNSKIYEILAKAENLKQLAFVETTGPKDAKKLLEDQKQKITENKITYNGIRINEIFADNKNGKGIQAVFMTFEAGKVTKVKEPIYLTVNSGNKTNNTVVLDKFDKFSREHPKMYISEIKHPKAYKKLNNIIENESYWGETTEKFTDYHIQADSELEAFNIIDIMKKGHDELCYSELLRHFFEANHKAFTEFVSQILEIENFSENYNILREHKNIDILIDDYKNKNVIVIENKIKSGINGICCNTDDNKEKVQSGDKKSKVQKSQLDKYYDYITKDTPDNKYKNYKKKKFYIFSPDYNHIDLKGYINGKKYKEIKYSKIFDFFRNKESEFNKEKYFKEFLYALQKHTKPVDNSNEEELFRKFTAKIEAKK